ncbi:MAG TPA: hypothetical protein VII50_03505 [Acidothermaceae bacterium]
MNGRVSTAFAVLFLVAACGSGGSATSATNPPPSPTSAPLSVPPPLAKTGSFPPWLTSAPASSYLSESSSATGVSLPADGEYMCVSKQIAICRDQGGEATATTLTSGEDTDVTPTSGVTDYDPTLSVAAGTVYFRQTQNTATAAINTIHRVSVHGGPSTPIITAPQNNGDEGVGLGSPQISPDGRLLAYVITVGRTGLPSSAIPAPTGTLAPLGTNIFVLNEGAGATAPLVVPSTVTGPELPDGFTGYRLVGWSPDDRQLYYFGGPTRELRALTFDATEHPISSSTVVQPSAPQSPCPDSPEASAMSPNGDVYFVAYCQETAVTIERVHNGQVFAFASIPELTGGWITVDVHIDTTGRYLQLDAVPLDTHCLGGSAYVALLDGVVIAKQIQTNPYGCPPGARP